jgi:hypothetical protein
MLCLIINPVCQTLRLNTPGLREGTSSAYEMEIQVGLENGAYKMKFVTVDLPLRFLK